MAFTWHFLVWPLLPTYRRCTAWLLHLITLNGARARAHTHTHTHTHTNSLTLTLSLSLSLSLCRTTLDEESPVAETWQHNIRKRHISMPLTGFEPTIPASERPQNYALNCVATWNSLLEVIKEEILCNSEQPISWPSPETGPSKMWKKPLNGEPQIFVLWRRRRDSPDTVTVRCVLYIHCALSSVNPVNSKLYLNNKLSPVPALQ